jgi:hypothetical protein
MIITGRIIFKVDLLVRVKTIVGCGRNSGKAKFPQRLGFSGGGLQTNSFCLELIFIGIILNRSVRALHARLSQKPPIML